MTRVFPKRHVCRHSLLSSCFVYILICFLTVLVGSPVWGQGLSADFSQFWHQGCEDIVASLEADDGFGKALAVGDFNGDGCDDLAIGVLGEDLTVEGENIENAGAVNVLYGSKSEEGSDGGLTAKDNQLWHQDSDGIADVAEAADNFGSSLAAN